MRVLLAVLFGLTCVLPAAGQDTRLTFDVATIRLAKPDAQGFRIKPIAGGHGYTATNMSVRRMISVMYRVPPNHVTGGPDWLDTQGYDVEARCEGEHSIEELHVMFQNLMADRMGLQVRKETREGNVYALTADPAGVKMTVNDSSPNMDIPITPGPPRVTGVRVSMDYLSYWLGQVIQNDDRPVLNMTGLDKNYDFKLIFQPPLPPGFDETKLPDAVRDLPDVFTALREQLGLKLTPQKGLVTYLVVTSANRPSDN